MSNGASTALESAIGELWRLQAPGPDNLFASPEFGRLRDACKADYANAALGQGPTIALSNALRSLGLPCGLEPGDASRALPAHEAVRRLDDAFRRREGRRLHLCPLDLADDLPAITFGSSQIRHFNTNELLDLIDAPRLRRVFPGMAFDAERFSQFHWLVVEERVAFDAEPEARALPVLFMNIREDIGRIEPHKGRFPKAVEDALFFALLAPWEDWSTMPQVDWRGFRIPWVYTLDDDLFVRPQAPPSPDSLSWEPYIISTDNGETIEIERPVCLPLGDAATPALKLYDDAAWSATCSARLSPLFETPIAHFLVRAFLTEEMDEVLAHITTIEAALGLHADYGGPGRSKPDRHKGLGATKRMAARVAALLGGSAFAQQYEDLFNLRSAFLHGRAMGSISTNERVLARKLARQVVCTLMQGTSVGIVASRDSYLEALLDQGRRLI
jgi:hypothetical protein